MAEDREIRRLDHPGPVDAAAFSPDGGTLAVAVGGEAGPQQILLWDLARGRESGRLTGHAGRVRALAFAPGGRALATAGEDATLRLWDLKTLQQIHKVDHAVRCLAFGPDGKALYISDNNGMAVFDPATGRELRSAAGPHQEIVDLAWSPDGRLVAATDGRDLFLWEAATRRLLRAIPDVPAAGVAFRPDGRGLVSWHLGETATVRTWDVASGKEGRRVDVPMRAGGGSMAVTPDGSTLASYSPWEPGAVTLVDLATKEVVRKLQLPFRQEGPGHPCMAFTPSGRGLFVYRCSQQANATFLATSNDEKPRCFDPHAGRLEVAVSSPDERSAITVGEQGTLTVWERATAQPRCIRQAVGPTNLAALSPCGRFAALANKRVEINRADGKNTTPGFDIREEVRLVDLHSGEVVRRFRGHRGSVTSLRFSPDGRTLASGGADTTVVLWKVPDPASPAPGAQPLTPEASRGAVGGSRRGRGDGLAPHGHARGRPPRGGAPAGGTPPARRAGRPDPPGPAGEEAG